MKQGGVPTLKRKNGEFLGRQHVADSEDSDRPAVGGGWSRKVRVLRGAWRDSTRLASSLERSRKKKLRRQKKGLSRQEDERNNDDLLEI
jgi:hypothetical protein